MTVARAVTVLAPMPGVHQRGGALLVAAWGLDMARLGTAARPHDPDRAALSQRLAARRGTQRALMAGAPSIVVSAVQRLARYEPEQRGGAPDVDEHRRAPLVECLTRRLTHLGSRVGRVPVPAA